MMITRRDSGTSFRMRFKMKVMVPRVILHLLHLFLTLSPFPDSLSLSPPDVKDPKCLCHRLWNCWIDSSPLSCQDRLLFPHSSLFVNSQVGYEVIYLEENESIAQETCYLYLVNSKVISWSLDNETRENEVICDHLLSSS
jgi:hypothetical protein